MILSPTKSFIERHHVLVARVVVESKRSIVIPIRVFNPGVAPVTLKEGMVTGVLQPAMVLEEVGLQSARIATDSKFTNQSSVSVPNHLQMLYAESCANLPEDSRHQLAQLLQTYGDVFSTRPTDLERNKPRSST